VQAENRKQQTTLSAQEASALSGLIHREGYRKLAEQIGVHRESLLAAALGVAVRRGTITQLRQALGANVVQLREARG
jgi:hypothetical protein